MKTTHVTSKGSEAKSVWQCYMIWWFDALALLVIIMVMSLRRIFLQQPFTHQVNQSAAPEEHDAEWAAAHSVV
jgi:hypothetical protein